MVSHGLELESHTVVRPKISPLQKKCKLLNDELLLQPEFLFFYVLETGFYDDVSVTGLDPISKAHKDPFTSASSGLDISVHQDTWLPWDSKCDTAINRCSVNSLDSFVG